MLTYSHAVLFIAVVLFGALHSLLAANQVKNFLFRLLPSLKSVYRFGYTLIAAITLIPIVVLYAKIDEVPILTHQGLQFGAMVILVLGMILLLFAFKSYNLKIFVGLDFSEESDSKEPLVVSGMYRYVRHPLYFALIVLFIGFALLYPDFRTWVLVIAMLIYIVVGSKLEERKLTQRYGKAYKDYCRKTKRWIPFVI